MTAKPSRVAILAILAILASLPLQAQVTQAGKSVLDGVLGGLDSRRDHYADVAKRIWTFAEVGYQEQKSSGLLQSELTSAGFTVKSGVADEPTAFVASWGSGKPVIAIVGEFDALPGLSQDAVPTRQPLMSGAAGLTLTCPAFGQGRGPAPITVTKLTDRIAAFS